MNGGGTNDRNETDLPLNSTAIPKHLSSHGASHATTATTSTYGLDEFGSQNENRCKNQKLMEELANLKSEIGMLKQMQNDQSQMCHSTINQSQFPSNLSQIISHRSRFSAKPTAEYEELLLENASLKSKMAEKD
jgi:TolA-binding protein